MQTEVSTFIGKNHQNLGFKKKKKKFKRSKHTKHLHDPPISFLPNGRKRREKKEFWWYMVHACPQISPELHLVLHLHLPQDKATKQRLWVKWVSNQNTNTTQNSMVLVVATTWEWWFNGIGVGEMVVVVGESGGPGGKYKEPNNRNWEKEEHEERTQINELSIFLIIGINDHD